MGISRKYSGRTIAAIHGGLHSRFSNRIQLRIAYVIYVDQAKRKSRRGRIHIFGVRIHAVMRQERWSYEQVSAADFRRNTQINTSRDRLALIALINADRPQEQQKGVRGLLRTPFNFRS